MHYTFTLKNIRINWSFSTRHQYQNMHRNCVHIESKKRKEITRLTIILSKSDTDTVTILFLF